MITLSGLRRFYPKKFETEAITVNMGFKELDFSADAELCKTLDINYTIVESEIAEIIFEHRKESNPCSLCAKIRKGAFHAIQRVISRVGGSPSEYLIAENRFKE